MALLAIIGLLVASYYLLYIILPLFLDCDFLLAFMEKFGKPVCKYILILKKMPLQVKRNRSSETAKYNNLERD